MQGHSPDAHSLDRKSPCMNLLYFSSVFLFYRRCQKRLRRKIYCFHNSCFCVAHTFTLKNVPSQSSPLANAHAISSNVSFIYLLLNWKTIQMSLTVMEMMVVVDNQNAMDVLQWWEPFCGSRCLYCVTKYVNIHINLADLKR